MTSNESLDTLSPAAKLALLHAQAANPSTNQQVEQDPFVPSPDDPVVVMDNSAYEPLIAGDFPTPIGKPISSIPAPKKEPATKKKLDLSSESAFPSLSASPRAPVASNWATTSIMKVPKSGSGSPRPARPMAPASGSVKKNAATQVTDVLELPANQQISNMPNKPLGFKSSADVIQQVINKTGTNIIASTNRSGTTTFLIQGTPNDVNKAKRELIAGLVVKRTVEITVPANTRRFIIGAKGATLKHIEMVSGTRINFPRKDDEDYVHHDDDSDEAVIVSIMGDGQGIRVAKEEIEKIVGAKALKQTIKIEDLNNKYYLFLAGPQNSNIKKLEEEFSVKIHIPAVIVDGNTNRVTAISITGDKEKVQAAKHALYNAYADIEKSTRSVAIGIPKHQHKYLYGKNGETLKEILAESNCTVEIPPLDDPSENVTIIGPDADLVKGLTVIMEKARSHHVIHLDVTENYSSHGKNSVKYARCAVQYLKAKGSFKQIEKEYNVEVGVPSWDEMVKKVGLDFVSKVEKDATLAQKAVASIVRDLTPDLFGSVDIEAYLHQYILSTHRAAIDRIQASNNVSLAVPSEKENSSTILIVYVGDDKSNAKAAIENASAELKKLAADSSDYISKSTNIPIEFHDALRGPKGTTLNAIIGETEAVVRFGPKEKVEVRGLTKDVNQVMASLQKAFDAVQQDDFAKSFAAEFFIPANFSAHIIGKAGIHVNKLKDDLGVKIDIGDNNKSEEKTAAGKKDKKNAEPVKVTIQGPKINVEAAKERINSQVSNLADQVTLSLKVPKAFHRFLIGPSGRYVKKLEDKYNVFIKFPKSGNRGDESPSSPSPTNPDEITVRGGKKDAQSAKEELMELYEYEKEEQENRKEREQKRKEYEEKRAAEDKRRAEERAAREARDAAKEAAREAKRAEKEAAAAAKKE